MEAPLHIHVNRLNRRANIFLLFLPALIFAIILALLLRIQPQKEVANTSEPSILGDEVEISP
jgi:hypothetical protein